MSDSHYTFDSLDADIILRAPLHPGSTDFRDFRTHKLILSTASTAFHDIFPASQPQQPDEGDNGLPVVRVVEPAEVFEAFLRLIYPIEPPVIDSPQILDHLFQLAAKYKVGCVRARLKQALAPPSFLKSDPIWVYAIACRTNLDEEAELAIPHTYRIDLTREVSLPLLQAMTAETYNRLLRSHATRRDELIAAAEETYRRWPWGVCDCGSWFYTRLDLVIHVAVWERPFLDRRRLDSCLSEVEDESECKSGSGCRVSMQTTSAYLTSILDKIGELASHNAPAQRSQSTMRECVNKNPI